MEEQLFTETERLLRDLQSPEDAYKRRLAAERLGDLGQKEERIISALRHAKLNDENSVVRSSARASLEKLGIENETEPEASQPAGEHPPANNKESTPSLWKQIIAPILLLFLCALIPYIVLQGLGSLSFGDCSPEFDVFTFIDENADGKYQTGEPPLPGVLIREEADNISTYEVPGAKTNMRGEASLRVGTTNCTSEFSIRAEAPVGYRPTTAATMIAKEKENDKTIQFGFTYLPGTRKCIVTPEFVGQEVSMIVSGRDYLWVASSQTNTTNNEGLPGKLTRLNLQGNVEKAFSEDKDYFGQISDLVIDSDGIAWLITHRKNPNASAATPSNISSVYKFDGQKWKEFVGEELNGKQVESIAWLPDGRWLFATWGNGIVIWDTKTNSWTVDNSILYVSNIIVTSDGEFFPVEDTGGAVSPDGKIWDVYVHGESGLSIFYYDPAIRKIVKSKIVRLSGSVSLNYTDIQFDQQGGMWITTYGNGLLYIPDPLVNSSEKWRYFGADIGLPSDYLLSLLLERDTVFWIGTKNGLAYCEIQTH